MDEAGTACVTVKKGEEMEARDLLGMRKEP
jgi:hypothetical protein